MGLETHDITYLQRRVAHVGGSANDGSSAGVFCLDADGSSLAGRALGARLSHQNSRVSSPGPLAEYVAIKSSVPSGNRLAGWC